MKPIATRPRGYAAALAAFVLCLGLGGAPAASAAKPDRTVLGPVSPFVVPAGFGCAFDVSIEPDAGLRRTITEFDDGRVMENVNGYVTLTNLDSGTTFEHHALYQAVDTYDAATNDVVSVVHGQVNFYLWPGDLGPYGVVGDPGVILRFTGSVTVRLDLDAFVLTEFSCAGTFIDVCARLD